MKRHLPFLICQFLVILMFPIISSSQSSNDTFELQLFPVVDCTTNKLEAKLQIKSSTADSFMIGTSSVFFSYDSEVLSFSTYTSENFDENSPCFPGATPGSWAQHAFTATDSVFNLTIHLQANDFSCPVVKNEWITIGTLDFDILNINASPNIVFDPEKSLFNRNQPNNGTEAPNQGTLKGIEAILNTFCCVDPVVTDDLVIFENTQSTVEINVLDNDTYDNPSVSLITDNQQFSINPNGIITYTIDQTSCESDSVRYLLCNGTTQDCCQEGMVRFQFQDNTPPELTNCPADMTVECTTLDITSLGTPDAADNCQIMSLDYTDDITLDTNCNFSSEVITRTWEARDNSGNLATCTQRVTVTGNPCPDPINIDTTVLICSGQIIDWNNYFPSSNDKTFSGFSNNIDSLDTVYRTEADCQELTDSGIITERDENGCLIRSITIDLVVFPLPNASTVYVDGDSCRVKIEYSCPDYFEPAWETDSGAQGIGDTFTDTAGTSGVVTFTLIPAFSNYPDQSCDSMVFEMNYGCEPVCPQGFITDTLVVTGCEGEQKDILSLLQLAQGDSVFSSEVNTTQLAAYPLTIDTSSNCSDLFVEKELLLDIYNQDLCLTRKVWVKITITTALQASFVSFTDSCGGQLVLNHCTEQYQITWSDNHNQTGTGPIHYDAGNLSSVVTFTVSPLDSTRFDDPAACNDYSFTFEYDCDCPAPEYRDTTLYLCSGNEVEWANLFPAANSLTYTGFNHDADSTSNVIYLTPDTCEEVFDDGVITKYAQNGCPTEIITVNIVTFPRPDASVVYIDNDSCKVGLEYNCTVYYNITWQTSEGQQGTGNYFQASEGDSGTVTFSMTPVSSNYPNQLCGEMVYTAAFHCPPANPCPDTVITSELIVEGCEGEIKDILTMLELDSTETVTSDQIDVSILNAYTLTTDSVFDCNNSVINQEFLISIFDNNQCLQRKVLVKSLINPKLQTTFVQFDTVCGGELILNHCPEKYQISWFDSDQQTGMGSIHEPLSHTVTVTYQISPIDSTNHTDCNTLEYTTEYICDCPTPVTDTFYLAGCAGDSLNLYDHLPISSDENWFTENGTVMDFSSLVFENYDSCNLVPTGFTINQNNESGCLSKQYHVVLWTLPAITGEVQTDGCSARLLLNCPEWVDVSWMDDQENTGSGTVYQSTNYQVTSVAFNTSWQAEGLEHFIITSEHCFFKTFTADLNCCDLTGVRCDDNNSETVNDTYDENCECSGVTCELVYTGHIVENPSSTECGPVIQLTDSLGTLLYPAVIPNGEELVVGQSIHFYYSITDKPQDVACNGNLDWIEVFCMEMKCLNAGQPCSDGDIATINDTYDDNCNCIGEPIPHKEEAINVRLVAQQDCDINQVCATIQIRAQEKDLYIGTSSIMLNFNPDAVEYSNYTSHQFDGQDTCDIPNIWDTHQFDGTSIPGRFSLTMTLNQDNSTCPVVTVSSWEDVGTVCFDIMNNQTATDFVIDSAFTYFNSSTPNDGSNMIPVESIENIATLPLNCDSLTTDSLVHVELALDVLLQGPFKPQTGLMNDQLRKRNYLPQTEPYTGNPHFDHYGGGGGEVLSPEMLATNGANAIVDWVLVELRSEETPQQIVATQSALLTRSGSITRPDVHAPLQVTIPKGSYYIAVRHRNHLGVMTAEPIEFNDSQTIIVDFSDPETPAYGEYARKEHNGQMMLWGGDTNSDRHIVLAGGGVGLPDRDVIFFDIFLTLLNTNPNNPITYNSILHGYYLSDSNLDGKVKYQGPTNDIDGLIFFNILLHPLNTNFRLNYVISEQIP